MGCLILWRGRGAALREEVASYSLSGYSQRILVPWTGGLNDEHACGICTLTDMRIVELVNAEMSCGCA